MRLHEHVSIAETEDNVVLLDERAGQYWQLNPTGALALRTVLDGGTTEQAVLALTEQYEIDADRAAEDVTALLTSLRDAGLVIA
ncbi:lasso peptide biosynthesis PqqD family chaperone [Amycolatopsis nigrescens]|uniref:lasso peptide biosynthesis PqqD family chaperone n=1 Tax=Amycolatopsis nigrescens TaxID=381445 RepID=UPI000378520C|nr:lasso peptide biosynthesis PqqD family chaperone [Amycolatopsis nigrescens]